MSPPEAYHLLEADTAFETRYAAPRQHGRSGRLRALLLTTTVFLVGIVLLFGFHPSNAAATTPETQVLQCGKSPEEAKALGCIFEAMISSWMPPLCYFPEIAARHDDIFSAWHWYKDMDEELPIDDAWTLQQWRSGNYTSLFTQANAHELQ